MMSWHLLNGALHSVSRDLIGSDRSAPVARSAQCLPGECWGRWLGGEGDWNDLSGNLCCTSPVVLYFALTLLNAFIYTWVQPSTATAPHCTTTKQLDWSNKGKVNTFCAGSVAKDHPKKNRRGQQQQGHSSSEKSDAGACSWGQLLAMRHWNLDDWEAVKSVTVTTIMVQLNQV